VIHIYVSLVIYMFPFRFSNNSKNKFYIFHSIVGQPVKSGVFEVISADMIIKAGLTAASQLFISRKSEPC
jgi:hypothetical protein